MNPRDLLKRMPLREKCAQLVFPLFRFQAPDWDAAMGLAKKDGVGGFVLEGGSRFDVGPFANSLQKVARQPLLVAAEDPGRVEGATVFPSHLALGAAGSEDLAASKGRLTAREGLAMGVRWLLGPDPFGFGDDPALAAKLSAAFVRAVADLKVLTSLRGLPGRDVVPFAALAPIVDSVLLGPGAPPVDSFIRGTLGFGGLVAALSPDDAVAAVEQGADVVLAPPDPDAAIAALEEAVGAGRIADVAVYRSAERILRAKDRLGLFGERLVDHASAERVVGAVSHRAAAQKMAEAAVTRLRGPEKLEGPVALEAGEGTAVFAEELGRRVSVSESASVRVAAVAGPADLTSSSASWVVVLGDPRAVKTAASAAVLVAYGADEPSQRAAARALAGEIPCSGTLPVSA
jgi:beta-glucosidase-like glycosyl hydrolase